MAIKPISFAAEEPVSLEEAKAHLRIDHDDEDARISALISAARTYVEKQTNLALATQSYRVTLDSFPTYDDVRLDRGPVLSVTAVKYDDEDGNEQTLVDGDDYVLDNQNEPAWLIPVLSWPATFDAVNSVRIEYEAGWEEGTFPHDLKQCILLLVGHWYQNREAASADSLSEPPHSVHRIIHNHRVFL